MTKNYHTRNKKGFMAEAAFTLVELLVVITILGVIVTIGLVAFASSQARSRDVKRKSDLKQVSNALELFYSDYQKYPSSSNGLLQGCNYNSVSGAGGNCVWGTSQFSDTDGSGNTKTVYFRVLPKDPVNSSSYFYRIVDPPNNQKFQLFATLENSQDPSIISLSNMCGSQKCNFAITSPNTTPTE